MGGTIRRSTAERLYGKVRIYEDSDRNVPSDRIATLHHADTDSGAFWAEQGYHIVNVMAWLVFQKPLPEGLVIIGWGKW